MASGFFFSKWAHFQTPPNHHKSAISAISPYQTITTTLPRQRIQPIR
jgi:hypothetical protein